WGPGLALLGIDPTPRGGWREGKVGLAALKRRDLQYVHDLRDACALLRLVHVREDRHAEFRSQLRENRQGIIESDAAIAFGAGAVRLVEGRFVDEANSHLVGDFLQRGSHLERVLAALERAGPGDQHERQTVAEARRANGDSGIGSGLDRHGGRPGAGPVQGSTTGAACEWKLGDG